MRVLLAIACVFVAASAHSAELPRSELYPARSGRFSQDEERAIAVASARLAAGGQKRLDAFFKVTRKGKEFWVFALVTGGRPKWGQEGFLSPALYTVVVSPSRQIGPFRESCGDGSNERSPGEAARITDIRG